MPVNAKVKLSGETVFSCEVCPKTYIRKAAIKKHIQMKHAPLMPPKQISKEPIPIGCAEMTKNVVSVEIVDDTTLDERPDIIEEIGPKPMESNWQCGVCANLFEDETTIQQHMDDTHETDNSGNDKIVYLIPEQCKQCRLKDKTIIETETEMQKLKANENKFDVLERRHEQLKQKYDDLVKANKEYSKNLFSTINENTELKVAAQKEAEILMDTLHMNQVLLEEIKVKDAIIKSNEEIQNIKEKNDSVRHDVENVSIENETQLIKCTECEWTSSNVSYLSGHMLKHVGQYFCPNCKARHKTRSELNEHIQSVHKSNQDVVNFECKMCDKVFVNEHSLKQHASSKHLNERGLPVGHPIRAQVKNQEKLNIKCTKCDEMFSNGRQVDEHMKLHTMSFEKSTSGKSCRYFRNGYCAKGEHCIFKHEKIQPSSTPVCNRGQDCIFMQQKRCNYFHPNIGVQRPRERNNKIPCRFQDQCWNKSECIFSHDDQVFRPILRKSRPPHPQGSWWRNTWEDY